MGEFSLIISGFGGQGVLTSGRLVAQSAMNAGKEVSWLPSYGPEMRGGTANCNVIVSESKIGSPIINFCDALIALNRPSLEKFESHVKEGGYIIYDSTLIDISPQRKDIHIVPVEASKIASEHGNMTFASIVLLGYLAGKTHAYTGEDFQSALEEVLSPDKHDLIPLEMKLFNIGYFDK